MSSPSQERVLQLLADQVTEGLDAAETLELNQLVLGNAHARADAQALERAAAAIHLALMPLAGETLPGDVRDRVLIDAGGFWGNAPACAAVRESLTRRAAPDSKQAWQCRRQVGWCLAAASVALLAITWWLSYRGESDAGPGPQWSYQSFVDNTPNLVRASWVGKESGFTGVSGDVVWSNARQRGFMRLVGLPVNDPQFEQYQLWIVDPQRDKHPVDGGVFDVPTTVEFVVEFDAAVPVQTPQVFAITREQPGGVVVSSGPLLVVGSVGG